MFNNNCKRKIPNKDKTIANEYKGYLKNLHSSKRNLKRSVKKISFKRNEKYIIIKEKLMEFLNYLISEIKERNHNLLENIN